MSLLAYFNVTSKNGYPYAPPDFRTRRQPVFKHFLDKNDMLHAGRNGLDHRYGAISAVGDKNEATVW
jgi:hypothetical protein